MKSETEYTNRYNDKYRWKKLGENTFEFIMEGDSMKYCRAGSKEGQSEIDNNDLGMFDPSGGPFVGIGDKIDDRVIKRLSFNGKNFEAQVQ